MMDCEDVEMLMADALGDELADSDRGSFEGHLALCVECRNEYQSMVGAVDRMRSLPGSSLVSDAIAREAVSVDGGHGRRSRTGVFSRYAASVLLAFGAGYAFRGESRSAPPVGPKIVTETSNPSKTTLETALVSLRRSKPDGSSLSMAMMAMFSTQ